MEEGKVKVKKNRVPGDNATGKRWKRLFIGITADANTLGVTPHHLRQVLNGSRRSRSLINRYCALQQQKQKAG